MRDTPKSLRAVIAIAGRTNAGKSALLNSIVGQETSIVSDIAGTTTDTVAKNYELTGYGPVTFIDTAGLGDESGLAGARGAATEKALRTADFVMIVVGDGDVGKHETALIDSLKVPHMVVFNKADLYPHADAVCALTGAGVDGLKQRLVAALPLLKEAGLLDGLVENGDTVLLVAPQDAAAPKGGLIMPQVHTLRALLDMGAVGIIVQPEQLEAALKLSPKLVISDSQVVKDVAQQTDLPLTTFSLLFGRFKGDLALYARGASAVDRLKEGDRVMVAESCSHTTTEDDIARVKLPKLLEGYTGKKLRFSFAQGTQFPGDLAEFALVLHCGGCMLTARQMAVRLETCVNAGVAVTNYGMAIAKCQGVLERVIKPLLTIPCAGPE